MSSLFAQPSRSEIKDATTSNHRLLVQAGFVDQLMAGVFTYLPLGLRVVDHISTIVREELATLNASEILMPALHPSANWKQTGGWDSVDVLFKIMSRTQKEYALGQSHEEIVTPLMQKYIRSYRDLPRAVYQIQWKYRDELRAKSGIMRGREFLMKDMYSFHATQEEFGEFYQKVKEVYKKIFARLGLDVKITEASGGNFTNKISYEFMVLTDAGEDDILYCSYCDFCTNTEIVKTTLSHCPRCSHTDPLNSGKASEVGNVFDLGQKFSESFHFTFTSSEEKQVHPIMGCYGIGITRIMGVIVEKYHDERGILWPKQVTPYDISLLTFDDKTNESLEIYTLLTKVGLSVLWDDRDVSKGTKLADADLIGNPVRVVVSQKSIAAGGVEISKRGTQEIQYVSFAQVAKTLSAQLETL